MRNMVFELKTFIEPMRGQKNVWFIFLEFLQTAKIFASCSRCGHKVKLNIVFARETKKAKTKSPIICAKYKNGQYSIITAEE